MFVKVNTKDSSIPEKEIRHISLQVESYLKDSGLADTAINLAGINVYLNSELVENPSVSQINPKLYWAYNAAGIEISSEAWRMFCLKCIHIELSESVQNLVIVLMKKNSIKSDVNQMNDKNPPNLDSEDNPQSYVAVNPKYRLEQVVMLKETQLQIERAIALVRNQKKIFEEWGFSEIDPNTKTILCFYGDPGTGKTMCAHALAHELGKKILIASYASIESKWVGEGPKNLQKIFKDAEEQDAILFFDEADSFLSKRVGNAETGSDKHYNRMSNEMFQLLENYNGIIVFATNLVTDFDKAFKSRILAFVEFKKPDFETRKVLIRKLIPSKLPLGKGLSDEDIVSLSNLSDGFSGREIRKAILTTLTDGAVKNIDSFTIDEFVSGFTSVKEETASIEASMSNCIKDFLQYNEENQSIVHICQKAINQFDCVNELTQSHLNKICRSFDMELPDLTVSYKAKDISAEVKVLQEVCRIEECAIYCSELIARSMIECNGDSIELDLILEELGVQNRAAYQSYVKIINQILS